MKILAVDDDASTRELLVRTIAGLGFEVFTAPDGAAAWDVLCKHAIRVIVCDWDLACSDGLDLCRRIRLEYPEYVYFILLTSAELTNENHERAFDTGVDDFLARSADPRELRTRLKVAERVMGFTNRVRQLESFLPICAHCKSIRDDQNYWKQIELYINERAGTRFTHSICPTCYDQIMAPQLRLLFESEDKK